MMPGRPRGKEPQECGWPSKLLITLFANCNGHDFRLHITHEATGVLMAQASVPYAKLREGKARLEHLHRNKGGAMTGMAFSSRCHSRSTKLVSHCKVKMAGLKK